jgi:dimethylhistidine N-methyltransferase
MQMTNLATAGTGDPIFRADVIAGLTAEQKTLPAKYFYDAEGSRLFEEICGLPEYYLTRTEIALLRDVAPAISTHIRRSAALVEFGSGASVKTRLLLDAAPQLGAYVPIDISESALAQAAHAIATDYPALAVTPIAADFTRPLTLPDSIRKRPIVGFFPGSTIGNFTPDEATALMAQARKLLGATASFLVGADLVKSAATLVSAYDDGQGVTAAFNKNLLVRINRELDGDFDLDSFRHRAVWNAKDSRMEMHLLSTRAQRVTISGEEIDFAEGQTIHTENSYKYTPELFGRIAGDAGWEIETAWISREQPFAIYLLRASTLA